MDFLQGGFSGKKKDGKVDFLCACKAIASLSTPERFSCALVNWRMCVVW